MKRLDGISQNPHCYNIKDLTVGDLLNIHLFQIPAWIIDGDKQVIRRSYEL